ncbi:fimbrial protein [Bacteroides hominis]|uniref:fimbrial protein n=1 Tax=Bacteroides hominis TaxID=2763023 RepID=UPI003D6B9BE6
MKKNYLMAMALASMVVGGASCTKEVLETPDSAVVKGQTGKVVFRLDTGGSASFTRATLSEAETKITSLSVHLFKADGTSLTGYKKDYTEADISDSKLNVTIPTSLMGEKDVKAYLVANVSVGESGNTEEALKEFVSTIQAGNLSGGVIPMASPPVNLNLSSPVAEASVSMKRTMSAILVKVGEGADFEVGDFTYKLKDVRTDKGYLFKDMVVNDGSGSNLTLTPGADGLLGYIYQSPAFTIEVAPKNGTALASAGTRVVQVQANSAMKRNKKYVLTLLPKKAKESDPSSTGFTIEFEEWDSADTFNVEWNTRVALKNDLQTNLYEVKDNHLRLLPEGAIGSAGITNYGTPKSWLKTIGDVTITKVTMPNLIENGAGIPAPTEGTPFQTNWELHTPNLNDITGTLIVTTINNKDKQESESEFDVILEGQYITWKKSFSTERQNRVTFQSDAKGRAMDLVKIHQFTDPTTKFSLDIFTLAEGWSIQDIRAKKPTNGERDFQKLIDPNNNSEIADATIRVTLNTEKNAVTFRCGSKKKGYADIIVTIKKGTVTKERFLRITNRWTN